MRYQKALWESRQSFIIIMTGLITYGLLITTSLCWGGASGQEKLICQQREVYFLPLRKIAPLV